MIQPDYYILRPAYSPDCEGMWVVELWEINTGDEYVRSNTVLFDGIDALSLARHYAESWDIPAR